MSFKVICCNCGNEIEFKNGFQNAGIENKIDIYFTTRSDIVIECCECGNDIISG